ILTINLTFDSLDLSVSQSSGVLIAAESGQSYQWLDCNNALAPIAGETNQSLIAPANGSYAVAIVASENCTDTSACYTVTGVGLAEQEEVPLIRAYPNPTAGGVFIDLGTTQEVVDITVRDVLGQVISQERFQSTRLANAHVEGASGLYFLEVRSAAGAASIIKVIKE
ncbi:MAG: T9SS type A sorting domain-containing protein, partial [Bacteroidota bacterium]